MNIPECFENFIGVRYLCTESGWVESTSGLYIDELQGINLEVASEAVTSGLNTGENLLKHSIRFSTSLVLDDFRKFIDPYFDISTVYEYKEPALFTEKFVHNNGHVGFKIKRRVKDLQVLRIRGLKVLVDTDVEVSTNIIIDDGIYLEKFPIIIKDNDIQEYDIEYTMTSCEMKVYLEDTSLSVNQLKLKDNYITCCGNSSSKALEGTTIYGIIGDTDFSKCLFGIYPILTLECDISKLFCILKDHFKYIILYRAGVEFFRYVLASNRATQDTIYRREIFQELLEMYKNEYDSRYKLLSKSLKNLLCNMKDRCINDRQLQFYYSL